MSKCHKIASLMKLKGQKIKVLMVLEFLSRRDQKTQFVLLVKFSFSKNATKLKLIFPKNLPENLPENLPNFFQKNNKKSFEKSIEIVQN